MSKRFFAVAVNKPGYSPDGVHHAGNSVEEARDTLASEINSTADHFTQEDWTQENEDSTNAALEAAKSADLNQPIMLFGYAHTIIETDEDGYDKE